MTRILLAYPGGEVELHAYKRRAPMHDVTRKAASLASQYFRSWHWAPDGEFPVIESQDQPAMILVVDGPRGIDCVL